MSIHKNKYSACDAHVMNAYTNVGDKAAKVIIMSGNDLSFVK